MTLHTLKDAVLLYDGYNISGDSNRVSIEHGAEMLDKTTFGNDTRINHAGLLRSSAVASGFYDSDGADEPDDILFPHIGNSAGRLFSAFPQLAAEGDIGFSMMTARAAYNLSGEVGELFTFEASGEARSRLVRPTVARNSTETSSGDGTALNLGAVGATDKLYAILHVLEPSGTTPTLDVVIQSDDGAGFASPTTRITFAQVTTTRTGVYATPVVGPITDTWWRASWTIGGTSPSYPFVVGISILPTV